MAAGTTALPVADDLPAWGRPSAGSPQVRGCVGGVTQDDWFYKRERGSGAESRASVSVQLKVVFSLACHRRGDARSGFNPAGFTVTLPTCSPVEAVWEGGEIKGKEGEGEELRNRFPPVSLEGVQDNTWELA